KPLQLKRAFGSVVVGDGDAIYAALVAQAQNRLELRQAVLRPERMAMQFDIDPIVHGRPSPSCTCRVAGARIASISAIACAVAGENRRSRNTSATTMPTNTRNHLWKKPSITA